MFVSPPIVIKCPLSVHSFEAHSYWMLIASSLNFHRISRLAHRFVWICWIHCLRSPSAVQAGAALQLGPLTRGSSSRIPPHPFRVTPPGLLLEESISSITLPAWLLQDSSRTPPPGLLDAVSHIHTQCSRNLRIFFTLRAWGFFVPWMGFFSTLDGHALWATYLLSAHKSYAFVLLWMT